MNRPLPSSAPASLQINRVGIVAKRGLRAASDHLDKLASWLRSHNLEAVFETETATLGAGARSRAVRSREDLPSDVDLVVVMGGDGTLLGMATRIAQAGRDIPILGVNFGSLGFLTEVTLPELYDALTLAVEGGGAEEERLMLSAVVVRADGREEPYLALNDVVITKGPLSRMIDLAVTVDDHFVARFKADGLILATPTGSTAYNLSAGGPIVHPAVDAVVLTPIAPHTLTNRPIVLPASITADITSSHDEAQDQDQDATDEIFVTFDGQTGVSMEGGDHLRVTRAPHVLRLLKPAGRSYFSVLRQKLRWAER